MRNLRLGAKIISTIFKQSIYQLDWVIADAVALGISCGLLLMLYHYTFQIKGSVIAGQTYPVVAWSMFMYFLFRAFRLGEITKLINSDIQSGRVEMFINKPVFYLAYRCCYQVGIGSSAVILLTPLGIAAMLFFVPAPAMFLTGIFWLTAWTPLFEPLWMRQFRWV